MAVTDSAWASVDDGLFGENISNGKSLAFIGRAEATKRNCAEIFTALSITRLEGSRWWFAADAVVMEKVRKCGLMWSREETLQVRKVCGETQCVETVHPFWSVVVGMPDSMMKGL
jgi:hypothetical protein